MAVLKACLSVCVLLTYVADAARTLQNDITKFTLTESGKDETPPTGSTGNQIRVYSIGNSHIVNLLPTHQAPFFPQPSIPDRSQPFDALESYRALSTPVHSKRGERHQLLWWLPFGIFLNRWLSPDVFQHSDAPPPMNAHHPSKPPIEDFQDGSVESLDIRHSLWKKGTYSFVFDEIEGTSHEVLPLAFSSFRDMPKEIDGAETHGSKDTALEDDESEEIVPAANLKEKPDGSLPKDMKENVSKDESLNRYRDADDEVSSRETLGLAAEAHEAVEQGNLDSVWFEVGYPHVDELWRSTWKSKSKYKRSFGSKRR